MTEASARWDDVGARFAELGKHLKERYDANATFGDEDREKMNNALRQMSDSLDAGFTALGDSIRDPSMREDFKQAGVAIAEALSATFTEVADEIRKAVKK